MKKIIKSLFVVILGTLCVACGGSKTQYDLEGKYSLKKIEYFDNGVESLKLNANVEITKKGDYYTVVGKQLEVSRGYDKDYITKKVTLEDWEEDINDNFIFTGKIIEEKVKENPNLAYLKPQKIYLYRLQDKEGKILSLLVYEASSIKHAMNYTLEANNEFKGITYTGNDIADVISLSTSDDSIIKFNLTAIKEN